MKARLAAIIVLEHCKTVWPDDWLGMAKHDFEMLAAGEIFDITDSGTHKYIPTERLNTELGLPQGGGVYGYHKFRDRKRMNAEGKWEDVPGSGGYVLVTCSHGLAVWEGGDAKPEFVKPREPMPKRARVAQ